ncbi:hypothetical protein AB6V29_01415 [Microbacterium sp. 20-116]|uniref:hypothetical protein n=1 Tax=Microbacterium sp. 20-116 TaxID=3239883 RepID=UPI0034E21870
MPSVNIPLSAGYGRRGPDDTSAGTVYAPEWSALVSNAGGHDYGVIGQDSWKVTRGALDREIVIAAGRGFGKGVIDTTDQASRFQLPAPSSGSVWHLIVAHRDWAARQSSFTNLVGNSNAQLPARDVTPGLLDDQPIALVRVTAGQSQVTEIRDLRVWDALAVDDLVLQYLNRLGSSVTIGGVLWRRDINTLGNPVWVRNRTVDTVTDNNVLAGAPWDKRSPILSKFLSGSPQVAAGSLTTLGIPDGGFPNGGVLHVSVQITSGNSAKMCTVAEITTTYIKLQLLDEFGEPLPSGTAVPLSVRVDGWVS